MKRFKGSLILFVMLLMADLSHAEVVDRIVAIVNEDIITLSELNNAFEPYRNNIEKVYKGEERETVLKESKAAFLTKLIDNFLIDQEAKKNKISVSDEEVMSMIRNILARRNVTLENFIKDLSAEGKSLDTYKKDVKEQLIRMQIIRREIKTKVMVTDADIGEYYRTHRKNYEGREAVHVKQIFLPFPKNADGAVKASLQKDADDILKRLKNGEPFDTLAVNYSRVATVGNLGFIEKGMLALPEVEKAAFQLDMGGISEVIQSRAGFHIIMIIDKRGGGLKPIETVREEILVKLEEERMEKKFEEWMDILRKKSHIEIRL